VAYDGMEIWDGSVPLAVQDWEDQFAAWWMGWDTYWKMAKKQDGEVPEARFIPLSPVMEDRIYAPPAVPAWEIGQTDAPAELVMPVREYFEGVAAEDWEMVTRTSPHFDTPLEEEVASTAEEFRQLRHGEWHYAREIQDWWIEDRRAGMTVRGVEHLMGNEDRTTENREFVMQLELRMYRNRWYIWSWSMGWPDFGSAEARESRPTWLDGWD
ncbi:MAG: hypothetical protein AAF570_24115, partial [Bacteroidota bacterium]